LKRKLWVRMYDSRVDTMLTLDSLFGDPVTYWLADLDLENRPPHRRVGYEQPMYALVMPAFEHRTLREIGVALTTRFATTGLSPPAQPVSLQG
jgi:hypothetical protein